MSVCVCSVKFTDRLAGVGEIDVGYEGSSGGATSPIKTKGKGLDRADLIEEALLVG